MHQHRKPPVPKRSEIQVIVEDNKKNFLKRNAERVHQTPSRTSTVESPRYIEKKGYGVVPAYLVAAKERLKEEKSTKEEEEAAKAASKIPVLWPMPDGQRREILRKLQDEWQEKNQEFQRFGFVVDTETKRKRKEELLINLQRLEKDIDTMSKPIVYVTDREKDE